MIFIKKTYSIYFTNNAYQIRIGYNLFFPFYLDSCAKSGFIPIRHLYWSNEIVPNSCHIPRYRHRSALYQKKIELKSNYNRYYIFSLNKKNAPA